MVSTVMLIYVATFGLLTVLGIVGIRAWERRAIRKMTSRATLPYTASQGLIREEDDEDGLEGSGPGVRIPSAVARVDEMDDDIL